MTMKMGGKRQPTTNNQQSTGMAQVGGDWQRERLGAARQRRGRTMKMGEKKRLNNQPTGMAQVGGGW
jgi:hypothetical protein